MRKLGILVFILISCYSCKEVYEIPTTISNSNLLVVEGVLNVNGLSNIILSRTINVADTTSLSPETGATVIVENENNVSFNLTETNNGVYQIFLNNNQSRQFRLKISTSSGVQYQSAYTKVNISPSFDLSFNLEDNGVEVNIDSEGDDAAVRNYRYEFEETWEIETLKSDFKYVITNPANGDGVVVRRVLPQDFIPFICYPSKKSTEIILENTKNLSANSIRSKRIVFLESNSVKLQKRYSILVKQYTLNDDAFVFWSKLKKNTEQLGTIFSPLPSEIQGNMVCLSNPNEPVIGFFEANGYTQKRIFINPTDVPNLTSSNNTCKTISIPEPGTFIAYYYGGGTYIPTQSESVGALATCVDCRLTGTDQKPPFW